ncbi:hypothetical protein ACFFLE_07560 [Salinicoccus siamensis]|uniref:Uncharacterized protein n=1 Tax=Salinicoccus siamensis TaxID=381830 RepID=A0ABV5Z4C6_9STAP
MGTMLLGSTAVVDEPTAEASVVKHDHEVISTLGRGSGYLPDGRPAPIDVY